ncbi:MAG TPA: aminotransferase class IV [Acidimicrobiales bacterium]|nr:aminotransferase class IV [Acidimicrobiales bacterium]
MSVVWIDGSLKAADEARVSPFDHGLLTGDGVFETLRVTRGVPFAARRHHDRLARSATAMGLPVPPSELVGAALADVVAANHLVEGRLRVTLTGGPAPLGSDRADVAPTLIVAGGPLPNWPASADVATVLWPRNERGALAGIKTISYGENVIALARARQAGAGEAIFANLAGNLCEGTGTNVFIGTGGRLVTPPLSSGCLAGVTRELLLEVADIVEEDVPAAALATADEAFLTSSTRDVQPIRRVDAGSLPACPGPLTAAAAFAFRQLLAADDLDP